MKKLDDGNIQVKFTAGGTFAICQELFKWGSNVQVIRPIELRTYYKTYLKDILDNL